MLITDDRVRLTNATGRPLQARLYTAEDQLGWRELPDGGLNIDVGSQQFIVTGTAPSGVVSGDLEVKRAVALPADEAFSVGTQRGSGAPGQQMAVGPARHARVVSCQ